MENQLNEIATALKEGAYATAELLIRSTTEAHILDEPGEISGHGLTVPLGYVLAHGQVNLFLAKLLVETGANPNIRIEYPHWGGATESPLALLVNLLVHASSMVSRGMVGRKIRALHSPREFILEPSVYKVQLLEVLDTFLARGGDPNVTTSHGNATVFHVALAQHDPDIEVIKRLSAAGGDLNQTNVHGTTVLMDLVKNAKGDLALKILAEIESRQPDLKTLLLNAENCCNETALWNACYAGSPCTAIELMKRGADASYCQMIVTIPDAMMHAVSPLLAPLLPNSYPYMTFTTVSHKITPAWSVSLMNKVTSYAVSPIVDTFTACTVPFEAVANLKGLMDRLTSFKAESLYTTEVNVDDIPVLMFGHLSAGLQQMCVKVIMEQVMESGSDLYTTDTLTSTSVTALVKDSLGLPSSLVPRFNIEAARIQLSHTLFKARANVQCVSGCENVSDEDDGEFDESEDASSATSDEFYSDDWLNDPSELDGWETMTDQSDDSYDLPSTGMLMATVLAKFLQDSDGSDTSDTDMNADFMGRITEDEEDFV